ncbi:MAG: chemotaxis protein CheX [Deltaproteobacteria bacterium]|nr:chemotaxis protein CheX [Deltaproteobacteria bacterium]
MDVKFINPFLKGTLEVLKKMAFLDPLPGKVYLKETSVAYGDVSGIIGITGDVMGSLAISFKEACICDIISRMLGESCTETNQDVFDGVGEITNMISGVARTYLEKEGMAVYAAIPAVVYGRDHTINHILNSPSIVIPFATNKGSFVVDVCIKKSKNEERKSEKYQVVNQKTPVSAKPPDTHDIQAGVIQPAAVLDKKTVVKNKLREITVIRDDMVKQLTEKPFMEISQRQLFKKRIPMLDAKIKQLRLDISTIEMLANITEDTLEHPRIVKHYQHYEKNK